MSTADIGAFVAESNHIEGIRRAGTAAELGAHERLWSLPQINVRDLEEFVWLVAGAKLRNRIGMNVRVGNHRPPAGGPDVGDDLRMLLDDILSGTLTPYDAHQRYEHLHPFMDGNGRSGRALWAWHMRRVGLDPFALPFLHRWYYQSLDAGRAS